MTLKTFRLFFCVFGIMMGVGNAASFQSIPFDKLGTEAAKKSGNNGLCITEVWNGYLLECRMQDLQAEVTMSGTLIHSTSESEGRGAFSIRADRLGRGRLMKKIPTLVGWVNAIDGIVKSGRGSVVEEYTTTGDGIKQDFMISGRPGGKGNLILELALEGAQAQAAGTNDAIGLQADGGRKLMYHALKVTDATGKMLEAGFEKTEAHIVTVAVDDKNAKYPIRIDPTVSDADWVSMGGIPGVDFRINVIVPDSAGNIYVGGSFKAAGNVVANDIAKWDGSAWSALGKGINSYNGVKALAFDRSGILYVGGDFDSAGSVRVNNIAKWDGSTWSALGEGTDNEVHALAVDDSGNLYAGGAFDTVDGSGMRCIAKWNGSAWSALGSGVSKAIYTYKSCNALQFDKSGNLYAGGTFDIIGGIEAKRIAKWDGAAWTPLGSGTNGDVFALAMDRSGILYAGGNFDTAGNAPAKRIARWDGAGWSALGIGIGGGYSYVYSLTLDGSGNLYAAGSFDTKYDTASSGILANNIAKWDGAAWINLGSEIHTNYNVTSVAIDKFGNLYVGGGFTSIGDIAAHSIAKWNGSAWSALGKGTNSTINTLAFDSLGNLYAGGSFMSIGGKAANHVAKWNGSVWSPLGGGVNASDGNGYVNALAISGAGIVYAAGDFDTAGSAPVNYVARWDGIGWSALGSGISRKPESYLVVNALAVDGSGNLYAGGYFDSIGGVPVHYIAKWDGAAWRPLGGGMNKAVFALLYDGSGNLYAGGDFDTAGGITVNNIAKWNGTAWSALGHGVSVSDGPGGYWGRNGLVYDLAMDRAGNIYACGLFDTASGIVVNHVARWNGSAWGALGNGIDHLLDFDESVKGVYALSIDKSGDLFAAGDFDKAGGLKANFIARWDGSAWSPLGSGFNQKYLCVKDLAADTAGNIYAGGNFIIAGGKVSAYIAKCKPGTGAVQPNRGNGKPSQPYIDFDSRSGTIRLRLQSALNVDCRVFTLTGREVFSETKLLEKGNTAFKINAAHLSGNVYIAQVKAGSGSLRFRMVVQKRPQ